MALSKKSNTESKKDAMQPFNHVKVRRAHDFGNGRISFDADFGIKGEKSTIENVFLTIYNLTWIEGEKNGREYKFVSMPQRKGSDGNYYNICRVNISDDLLEDIESQLSDLL